MIRYHIVEKAEPAKNKKKSESKQGNDDVMALVWKLMEYTQGSNDQNLLMKLIMPVFVGADTLEKDYNGKIRIIVVTLHSTK